MRKLSGMMLMILLAVLLSACGDDGGDEEEAPTVAPVETTVVDGLETEEATATEAADIAIAEDDDATEEPEEAVATPETVATTAMTASPASAAGATQEEDAAATPESAVAITPIAEASPEIIDAATPAAATPEDGDESAAAVGSDTTEATPVAASTTVTLRTLSGEVVLPGTLNEAFVISDEGCVGLGEHSDMQAGRQVVVRDERGTIVGVTSLQASDATDTCAWDFAVEVPDSDFYAVSIPMEVEYIFTSEDVEQNGGDITVPLR